MKKDDNFFRDIIFVFILLMKINVLKVSNLKLLQNCWEIGFGIMIGRFVIEGVLGLNYIKLKSDFQEQLDDA